LEKSARRCISLLRLERALQNSPPASRLPHILRRVGSSPFAALSGVHVLVVDDNADAREILRSLLAYLGAFVSTAGSADGALNFLTQIMVDVVVCDINLGDRSALSLIQEVRQHQPDTPLIAISGQDYDESEIERAGFVAYLVKPVGQERLVRTILRAVGR
jgi:CheY-like chemotaxis protein